MTERREYQERSIKELPRLLTKHRRVIAVGPTGCGKTFIGARVARAVAKRGRVLWVAHRVELLRQARDHLVASGIPSRHVGMLSGTAKENLNARVLVASVDIFRNYPVPEDVTLVVVDEAHHVAAKSYEEVIETVPDAVVLGLTATPQRLDGAPLDIFTHLHTIAESVELVADKHLLKSVVYGIPRDKARRLVQDAGGGKDYSRKKLATAMRKRPLMADIVKERERLASGQRTIVYACTREHGGDLLARFEAAGVPSAYVDANTPAREREELLGTGGLLARGKVQLVVNVGVLTEGFDCPPVSCIVVARPTKSLGLWRQMCGRGARYQKGKRYLVLDHAGNVWRHGFPDDLVEWSLDGRVKAHVGEAPIKLCGECGAIAPIAAKECPECGTAFPLTERELAERKAELERVRAIEAQRTRTREVLEKLAELRGLGGAWVEQAMREAS